MSADIDPSQVRKVINDKAVSDIQAALFAHAPKPYTGTDFLDPLIVQKVKQMSRQQKRKYFKRMHNLLFPSLSWEDFNSQVR